MSLLCSPSEYRTCSIPTYFYESSPPVLQQASPQYLSGLFYHSEPNKYSTFFSFELYLPIPRVLVFCVPVFPFLRTVSPAVGVPPVFLFVRSFVGIVRTAVPIRACIIHTYTTEYLQLYCTY